jgi:phage portal protein BeeE
MPPLSQLFKEAEERRARLLRAPAAPAVSPLALLSSPAPGGGNAGPLAAFSGPNQALNSHALQYHHNQGWVYSCVRAIAQRTAGQRVLIGRVRLNDGAAAAAPRTKDVKRPHERQLPLHLKDLREEIELVNSHPLLDALDDPNAFMVRWALQFVTSASLNLTGKSHWWMFEEKRTGRWQIMPLPANWVWPVFDAAGRGGYAGWKVAAGNNAEPIDVPAEEIVYFYLPDPANPLAALSPLQAQAKAVVADEAMQEAVKGAMARGIWPGYAVTVGRNVDADGKEGARPFLSDAQRAQVIAAIKNAYRGVLRWDEPVILDGWIERIDKLTNGPRDLDFPNGSKVTKGRITQGFGVNPIVMGEIEQANRASAVASEEVFCAVTVNPQLELMSQCLTAWVGPKFAAPGEKLLVWVEPARAHDPDYSLAEEGRLTAYPSLTVNELRGRHGLSGWGDKGEVLWVPTTLTPVRLADLEALGSEPPAAAPEPGAAPPAGGAAADPFPAGGLAYP